MKDFVNPVKTWLILIVMGLLTANAFGQKQLFLIGSPELFQPNLISTAKSEIKITFSADGNKCLWGTLSWENGRGGWDVWESVKKNGVWQTPVNVSFNSADNDFDPAYAPDGKGVYFFSNRPGGFGGDDLYYVAIDKLTGQYQTPQNLGAQINSKGDEWGPTVSPDGSKLMFCTDGRGGVGKHDLFISQKIKSGWSKPKHLGNEINSALDDFDATFLHDGKTIVFSSEKNCKDVG